MNEEILEKIELLKGDIDNLKSGLNNSNLLFKEIGLRISKHKHLGFDDTLRIKNLIPITVVLGNTNAATAGFYDTFFINKSDFRYVVIEVQVVWKTASTSGTLQIQRLQGTEAKGAGDDLLASTIDMSGTAETVNTGPLTVSRDLLELQKGDRLCLENAGTLTNQVNLTVTVYLEQI